MLLRGRCGRRGDPARERRGVSALAAPPADARRRGRGLHRDHGPRHARLDAASRGAVRDAPAARPRRGGRDRARGPGRRNPPLRLDDHDERARRDRGGGRRRAALAPALRAPGPAAHARPHRRGSRVGLLGARADGRRPVPRHPRAGRAPRLRDPDRPAAPLREGQGRERRDDVRGAVPDDAFPDLARPRMDRVGVEAARRAEGLADAGRRCSRGRARGRRRDRLEPRRASTRRRGRLPRRTAGGRRGRGRALRGLRRRRLPLGARAAFAGRPVAAGLAVGGAAGVSGVLELFRAEIELGLALMGCTSPAEVARSHVEPTVPYDPPS